MDEAKHEALAFMDFPKEHRVQIPSTNILERLNGGIKRWADVSWASSPMKTPLGGSSAHC